MKNSVDINNEKINEKRFESIRSFKSFEIFREKNLRETLDYEERIGN